MYVQRQIGLTKFTLATGTTNVLPGKARRFHFDEGPVRFFYTLREGTTFSIGNDIDCSRSRATI